MDGQTAFAVSNTAGLFHTLIAAKHEAGPDSSTVISRLQSSKILHCSCAGNLVAPSHTVLGKDYKYGSASQDRFFSNCQSEDVAT